MRKIRVGSRDSKLAVIQAEIVIQAIKDFNPDIQTELVLMKTTGDKTLDRTLDKIGGKGLFVKELDEALLDDLVDITVHSYKDLPMEINPDLPIVAVSRREDERDVLILPTTTPNLDKPIGCSSKRRTIQLLNLGEKNIAPLRGNVLTRLSKLDAGEYRAIILAAAGLKRLNLTERISRYFTSEEILPAACQGLLAVQTRSGEATEYLQAFHCPQSALLAQAERAFVAELDGGCSSPVAAYAQLHGDLLSLQGMYVNEESQQVHKGTICGLPEQAALLGRKLAKQLRGGNPTC